MADELLTRVEPVIELRDAAKREMRIRIVPWNTVIQTNLGLEMFERGAFEGTNPESVRLRMDHQDPATGKGLSIEEPEDAAYANFRVAKTSRGDDQIALVTEGVAAGASVGFEEVPGGTAIETRDGRRVRVHRRVRLREVSTTWRPAYEQAAVMYVRSETEGDTPVTEPVAAEAPAPPATPAPTIDFAPVTEAITASQAATAAQFESFMDRLAQRDERERSNITIPSRIEPEPDTRAKRGDWMSAVMRMLSGERVNDIQMRALADLVTTDNVGVVPDAFTSELIGVIDPSRPFLNTTRRLDLPSAGMSLVVPKIVTRPTAGVQSVYGDESLPEKSEIVSTATSITNVTFDAVTIAGGGDISLQLLKRSSPSYLSLFLELLAEALASNAEAEALDTLIETIGDPGGVNQGGTLDPEDLSLGAAWGFGAAVKKQINTMWLSSAGVADFINAKADGTNMPLYSAIQSGFTAGAGPAGTISGLRPVYVPALDATAVDVLVGPSSGFGWTEDGAYQLQVDVPAKAGRDVALVGIYWFAPMYPTAFTAYAI